MGPERADLGSERADLGPERGDLGFERGLGGDGRMDGRLEIHPCGLQDIGPLTPLLKKAKQVNVIYIQLNPALTEPPLTEFRI